MTTGEALTGLIESPGPCVLLMRIEAHGQPTQRRRVRSRSFALNLHPGTHRITLEDDRALHDPARHAGTVVDLVVEPGRALTHTFTLERGAVLRATVSTGGGAARYARVDARHRDGAHHVVRADAHGRVVLAGLPSGAWTLVAHDARRDHVGEPTVVHLATGEHAAVDLTADQPTARLLVQLHTEGNRALQLDAITVIDPISGVRVEAPVHDGLVDVAGLRPGVHRIAVPASRGARDVEVLTDPLTSGISCIVVMVPRGATVVGRVTQGGGHRARQHNGVVVLLDPDGVEIDRSRCDGVGRFELGRGLVATDGLTVVATTGPETLHVTQTARADVAVLTGVRHDLGTLDLPVGGPRAVWAPGTPAIPAMKLPSMRV